MSNHPRRNQRTDLNQEVIVRALQLLPGVSVAVGHDDILVGFRGQTYWYELKSENAVSRKTGKIKPSSLTDSERTRLLTWAGHYRVVWKLDHILEDLGLLEQ